MLADPITAHDADPICTVWTHRTTPISLGARTAITFGAHTPITLGAH